MADQAKPIAQPRTRSPNYPGINLQTAIARADAIFARVQRHPTSAGVIAKCWNLSEKGGGFMVQLGALRSFGFLENVKGEKERLVKLTNMALDLVADYPKNSPGWKTAIQRAALTPAIHASVHEKYGSSLPADDEIRRFLVREKKFNDRAVTEFIAEYRETMAFAGLSEDGTLSPAEEETDSPQFSPPSWGVPEMTNHAKVQEPPELPPKPPESGVQMRDLPVTLPTSLAVAIIRVPVPMAEKDFKTLVASLTDMKDTLVKPPSK